MGGSDEDAQAVARVRAGDPEAFRPLLERHARAVFRLAYRMTGNEHDAEDVVQETFLKAYRSLDRFEERSHFGSWLYRVATNCAYDHLRLRARRQTRLESMDEDDGRGGPAQQIASDDPAPDRLVWSVEVRRRVHAAMARLSAVERSAFTLRHLEGRSIDEICDALRLDESAAKHSVFRAVRKLRQALAPALRPVP